MGSGICAETVALLSAEQVVVAQATNRASISSRFYDVSSEPGCSRDQKQPCPDDDGPDGLRNALTGRCETFDGDGCHHVQVHDPHDQEDRH
jgi:hypothetical protein